MLLCGMQKTTLLDYPEHLAATLFTGGCNFRCPYCHNSDLLYGKVEQALSKEEVFLFLEKRKNILDGICISGGEPSLQNDLAEFIAEVRTMGFLVKLDTNGYRPDVIRSLLNQNLLDYIAMDIKNSPVKYSITTGVADLNVEQLDESIRLIMNGDIPYEFRTTVVKELHEERDLMAIAEWIKGSRAYYLQSFKESDGVIAAGLHPWPEERMERVLPTIQSYIASAGLRG